LTIPVESRQSHDLLGAIRPRAVLLGVLPLV